MKKILFLIQFLLLVPVFANLSAQTKRVWIAQIDGEIDLTLAPYVSRVIADAEKNQADAVLFRINTFGGRVDAATQIKDAILNSKVPTIAYVDKRAISAGALITLSCKKIAMAPGSSMGASTVVNQHGEKQSEKYQSFMRSEMRSAAEKNGRRTDVAEAMVDERVIVPGLDDSTRLVTLTAEEALKYRMADTIVTSLDEVLNSFQLKGAQIIEEKSNWAEEFVKFLNNPIVSSILIMIGLVGIFTEMKSPGLSFPGIAGALALALFFGSSYILQLASVFEIVLFVIGVILLIIEIFVIPGFGFTGVAGIVLMIASLFLSLISALPIFDFRSISGAIIQLTIALSGVIFFFFLIIKYLPKSERFNKLVLSTESEAVNGFVSNPDYGGLLYKTGTAVTDLRPAGIAEINGERVDVVADGSYIEKGTEVAVIKTEGARIVVKTKNKAG
jgi:membrane-bound serine protease (ClpP class)